MYYSSLCGADTMVGGGEMRCFCLPFSFFVFGGSTAGSGCYLSLVFQEGEGRSLDRDLIANDDDIRRMRHLMTTVRKMSLSSLFFSFRFESR